MIVPELGFTLLAMANELWNTVFNNSIENVLGSPEAVVQVTVADPPEARFSGVLRVRAEAKGTTRVKAL